MRTSVSFSSFAEVLGESTLDAIKKVGFDCLDYNIPLYRIIHGKEGFPNIEYRGREYGAEEFFLKERERIEGAGLEICQTHLPTHIYDGNRERFDEKIEDLKYAIMLSSILGAKLAVIHPAMPCWEDPDKNPGYTKDVNYYLFERLIPAAEEYGVTIALENMAGAGVPAASPQCLIQYIDMMNSDAMAACLDTGHANISGENIAVFVQKLGHRLKALHLNDNDGRCDEHYLPYMGRTGGWDEFMQALKKIGYCGTLNLEVSRYIKSFPAELRYDAAEMAFAVLSFLKGL